MASGLLIGRSNNCLSLSLILSSTFDERSSFRAIIKDNIIIIIFLNWKCHLNCFRDVATLCGMLTYNSYNPEEIKFAPIQEDETTKVFRPPVKDFAVAHIQLESNTKHQLNQRNSGSIILCISGNAQAQFNDSSLLFGPGSVVFLPANETLFFHTQSSVVLYQAFCNLWSTVLTLLVT